MFFKESKFDISPQKSQLQTATYCSMIIAGVKKSLQETKLRQTTKREALNLEKLYFQCYFKSLSSVIFEIFLSFKNSQESISRYLIVSDTNIIDF